MKVRRYWRGALVLTILLAVGCGGSPVPPQPAPIGGQAGEGPRAADTKLPLALFVTQPVERAATFPPKIAEAWKAANWRIGWQGRRYPGGGLWQLEMAGMDAGLAGVYFDNEYYWEPGEDVPAFGTNLLPGIVEGRPLLLPTLPAPDQPFGLTLTRARDEELEMLPRFQHLHSLSLQEPVLPQSGFKPLARLKELRRLSLTCSLTDAGLQEISDLQALQTLGVGGRTAPGTKGPTEVGLKQLARLRELKALAIVDDQVTDGVVKELANLPALQSLDLGGTKLTGSGLGELQRISNLRALRLSTGSRLGDQGYKALGALTGLQYLSLQCGDITDAGVQELSSLKDLVHLDLSGSEITDAGLKTLAALPNLRVLNLPILPKVTDAGLKILTQLQTLETLCLQGMNVSDAGVEELARLPHLRRLALSGSRITVAGLKVFAGHKLKELRFPFEMETDLGLQYYLAAVEPPKELSLTTWKVTDKGLKALSGQKFRYLSIPRDAETDLGLQYYLAALEEPPTKLDLSSWQVTDASLKEVAKLTKLEVLILEKSRFTPAGMAALQNALPRCKIIGRFE